MSPDTASNSVNEVAGNRWSSESTQNWQLPNGSSYNQKPGSQETGSDAVKKARKNHRVSSKKSERGIDRIQKLKEEAQHIKKNPASGGSRLGISLAYKLNEEIERGNDKMAYSIALTLAIIYDSWTASTTLLSSLFYILKIGFVVEWGTLFLSYFISAFLLYFLWGKGLLFGKWKLWLVYIIIAFFIPVLPAWDALPLKTVYTLYTWRVVKKRAKKAKNKKQALDLGRLSQKQMREINNNMVNLENIPDS